jgi:hypothetical protein
VAPLQQVLSQKRSEQALVNAVTTRFGSTQSHEIQEALREFQKAEMACEKEPKPLEDRNSTDRDSEATSDEDEDNVAQSGSLQANSGQSVILELTTDKDKALALEECYYSPLAGHFGTKRTLEKLSRRYH